MKLKIENLDDLWILFNVLSKGDHVYSKTFRRVKQSQETARSDKGERIPVFLGIEVEDVSFHSFSDRLRIKGKIISGPEDLISMGSYHTLNVDIGTYLEIVKDHWSRIELKRINEAAKSTSRQNIVLCAVDSGESTLAVVSEYQTKIVARLTENIPGSRASDKENQSVFNKFFSEIYDTIRTVLETYNANYVIIAGPGFVKDHLYEYILNKNPGLKGKIILDTVSGGDVSGINEIIKRGAALNILADLRVIEESKLVDEVLKRLGKNQTNVAYGFEAVKKAAMIGAVETILVLDELLRESDLEKRTELYNLLDTIEKTGGKINIISSAHQPGDLLKGLSGIAAILRFEIN